MILNSIITYYNMKMSHGDLLPQHNICRCKFASWLHACVCVDIYTYYALFIKFFTIWNTCRYYHALLASTIILSIYVLNISKASYHIFYTNLFYYYIMVFGCHLNELLWIYLTPCAIFYTNYLNNCLVSRSRTSHLDSV